MSTFHEELAKQKWLVLDGGLATELERRGHNLQDALWSARLLADSPQAIQQVHLDYLLAGADVIITASYQATPAGFRRKGYSQNEAEHLLQSAVRLAQETRDSFWSIKEHRAGRIRPLIAASVGPYGAYLADGSEYSGQYGLNVSELIEFHRDRLFLLAATRPDLIVFETIPSALEAQAIAYLLSELVEIPAWVSFSCRNEERINDETLLVDAVQPLLDVPNLVAVGVNCTSPRFLPSLLNKLRIVTNKPLVAYPNSGETYDTTRRCWVGLHSPMDFADTALDWYRAGARLIGGCCRTRPEHIRQIRQALNTIPDQNNP